LTVERVENGEVSPYLVEELHPGDQFEVRGPIGGYFVWTIALGGPLCLISPLDSKESRSQGLSVASRSRSISSMA
jgi:hypothetical protein